MVKGIFQKHRSKSNRMSDAKVLIILILFPNLLKEAVTKPFISQSAEFLLHLAQFLSDYVNGKLYLCRYKEPS